jgi:3-deoxy-D-manno-octulosonic-acid transferase
MENFREISGKFLAADAAIQVKSSEDLGAAWRGMLREPERAARMGARARELVNRNRGATDRVLVQIEQVAGSDWGGR